MPAKQTYSKSERLKSYKKIRLLFSEGEKFRQSPLVVHYRFREPGVGAEGLSHAQPSGAKENFLQAGVSVPARFFKRSVDRNLLKRRMREAYRKQKQSLQEKLEDTQLGLDLFWIYVENRMALYEEIHAAVAQALERLISITENKKTANGNE